MPHNLTNTPYFSHEKLAAYRYARAATQFVLARRAKLRSLPGKAGEQLERAVVGAQTNLCSGASAQGNERRRLFRIALTEAAEAGGANDIALDCGAFTPAEYQHLRELLLHTCSCLAGLARP